jgi:hypothetical protein
MSIQYQTDEQGNRVAVVIPLAEWEAIRERLAGERPVAAFGLTPEEARQTRARLEAFAPDWDTPEMDGYDLKAISTY